MTRGLLLVTILGAGVAAPQPWADPDAMEREAMALVKRRDFPRLGELLRDSRFIARLDNPAVGGTRRLNNVMMALAANADQRTAALCQALAADRIYANEPGRMPLLLEVLAAVKPMTPKTADLFRSTNAQGYFASNARRLAANGSPEALRLFESMMLATERSIGARVESLRAGFVPRRTALPILQAAGNILSRTKEPRLEIAVVEALFDYKPHWFRPENSISGPPAWETASTEALIAARRLAEMAKTRFAIPDSLRLAVNRESAAIGNALSQRPDRGR